MWYTNSDKKYLRRQLSLLNKMIPKWITMNSQVYWQVLISLLTFYKSTNSLCRSKDETNLRANEFIYKIKSWGTRKFYKSILVLLTTNVAEEGTSCKLKIYWHFKPHLGQSIEKENSESWKVKFYLAFLLNKRKFNAKSIDKGDNTLDLCATKQWALKYSGILLDKMDYFIVVSAQ